MGNAPQKNKPDTRGHWTAELQLQSMLQPRCTSEAVDQHGLHKNRAHVCYAWANLSAASGVFFFRVFFYHLQITFNLLVPRDLALEKVATFLRSESDTVEMAVTRHNPMESMKKIVRHC